VLYKTEAIVIKHRTMRGADKVVTLFSREFGKLDAAAYGAKKSKSKKRGVIEPLNHTSFVLRKGKNLDSITQCEIITLFYNLRSELNRLKKALYICELTGDLIAKGEPNEPLFILLLTTLKWLNSKDINGAALDKMVAGFEIKALGLSGYMPELTRCVNCGRALQPFKFSYQMGGILCAECADVDEKAHFINQQIVSYIKQMLIVKPGKLKDIDITQNNFRQIKDIFNSFIIYHVTEVGRRKIL